MERRPLYVTLADIDSLAPIFRTVDIAIFRRRPRLADCAGPYQGGSDSGAADITLASTGGYDIRARWYASRHHLGSF
jgi:hypothetical protein